ncbi:MAG: hypothetical protein PW788_14430 [Micavibrio sp.]|nr:hypothetical protein [Micavibrio sp.]
MSALNEVKSHLRPGQVYRRSDLEKWSRAVDRHVHQLLDEGKLTKLAGGLYYVPKQTAFGEAPADDAALVQAFLKDHRFLLNSPNAYNALGVGTTQLYNETVVYNHKRHGRFKLGGRAFDFRMKPHFPLKHSREFLLVDLVNNLTRLAEDRERVLSLAKEKALSMDRRALLSAVENYGGARAKKFFAAILGGGTVGHA